MEIFGGVMKRIPEIICFLSAGSSVVAAIIWGKVNLGRDEKQQRTKE